MTETVVVGKCSRWLLGLLALCACLGCAAWLGRPTRTPGVTLENIHRLRWLTKVEEVEALLGHPCQEPQPIKMNAVSRLWKQNDLEVEVISFDDELCTVIYRTSPDQVTWEYVDLERNESLVEKLRNGLLRFRVTGSPW